MKHFLEKEITKQGVSGAGTPSPSIVQDKKKN
jgi:hypothetical protein